MELIRKPVWLRVSPPGGEKYTNNLSGPATFTLFVKRQDVLTYQCWGAGTATIMIMGDTCSRGCRFCAVNGGKPVLLDPYEPKRVAVAIKEWGLKYVVITSVCRDDIEDGGAEQISKTIRAIKSLCPKIIVETLIPDLRGNADSIKKVVESGSEVISHNIETIRRLSYKIRDVRASYEQSLSVLKKCKEIASAVYTKSSIMLGLGESEEELLRQ